MNLIRSLMSLFLLIVVGLAVAGWMWAGDQPPEKMIGARVALTLCGVMAAGAIGLLWAAKDPRAVETHAVETHAVEK